MSDLEVGMKKGSPEKQGAYLVRFYDGISESPGYKVVYFDDIHGLLMLSGGCSITHYMSIDKLEETL